MNKFFLGIIFFSFLLACNSKNQKNETTMTWPNATAPTATVKEHFRTVHNDTVNDPYYWMYDYFGKGPDSTNVVNYLLAENKYTDTMLADTKDFQQQLFTEMKARIKEKDESVPVFKNGYFYYSRTDDGKQYYKYCRKKGSLTAPEEVLLDVDAMAEGKSYYALSGVDISDDNNLLAYGVDEVSRRQYTIKVKNLTTGEILPDAIENTEGDPSWAADNKTIFYTSKNKVTLLGEKIKRHLLGTTTDKDATVYEEKDKTNYIGVGKTKNDKYILITSQATLSNEIRILPANEPTGNFKVFQPRMKDVLYDIKSLDDKFLILTNLNAKNFRLMESPLLQTDSSNWKEIIPHNPEVLLENVDAYKDFFVVSERKNGLSKIRIQKTNTSKEDYVEFEEPTYAASVIATPDYNSKMLRYTYTSLITPNTIYDYNIDSKEKKVMKVREVLGGYNKEEYETQRLFATATDGTKIPISIVYKKGFKKDGNQPVLLYGYGSYGNSMNASFNVNALSLLNRGFAYAIAHIRGGQEMGRTWYEDGKMMKKKNSFSDFIDCGKYLINEKYTSTQHLYAQGGSAGGLLMGAVINMAPELWNGVIAQVPFVDVVNTMLDESIPLTTNEFDEWGNPKSKEAYDYMKSYSPYENIEAKAYPNLLVTTGLHDSQVQYFEPAKWVAKLRATKKGNQVILLHTNMEFGHGGASGRFDYLKDIALNYAFLFKLENITK